MGRSSASLVHIFLSRESLLQREGVFLVFSPEDFGSCYDAFTLAQTASTAAEADAAGELGLAPFLDRSSAGRTVSRACVGIPSILGDTDRQGFCCRRNRRNGPVVIERVVLRCCVALGFVGRVGSIDRKKTAAVAGIGAQAERIAQRSDRFQPFFGEVEGHEAIVGGFREFLTVIDHGIDTDDGDAHDDHHHDHLDDRRARLPHGEGLLGSGGFTGSDRNRFRAGRGECRELFDHEELFVDLVVLGIEIADRVGVDPFLHIAELLVGEVVP